MYKLKENWTSWSAYIKDSVRIERGLTNNLIDPDTSACEEVGL